VNKVEEASAALLVAWAAKEGGDVPAGRSGLANNDGNSTSLSNELAVRLRSAGEKSDHEEDTSADGVMLSFISGDE